MDFGMSVGKCKAGGTAMIARWVIDDFGAVHVGVSVHFGYEISIVDTVAPFVEQNERHCWSRFYHVNDFAKNLPVRPQTPIPTITVVCRVTISAHPVAHGHAADPRNALSLSVDSKRNVCGTMPDRRLVAAIL